MVEGEKGGKSRQGLDWPDRSLSYRDCTHTLRQLELARSADYGRCLRGRGDRPSVILMCLPLLARPPRGPLIDDA